MNKNKSSDMYSNAINNIAKDIMNNTKIIQSLKIKVDVNSKFINRLKHKSTFSVESRSLKNSIKKTVEKDIKNINDLIKKNERLRKSQEQYISKLKELKKKSSGRSYSTLNSKRNSSGSVNSIIDYYTSKSKDKDLDKLLDEVDLLLKMKMKSKSK